MLNIDQAEKALLAKVPQVKVAAKADYRDVYLFRVNYSSVSEADYDPFFSVNKETGEVKDFSVLHDGDMFEIAAAFADGKKEIG